jgi:NAD(P)H-dependent FMN reductase
MVSIDKKIIFVSHCPSENTKKLSDTVLETIKFHKLKLNVEMYSPFNIISNDVLQSDGIMIGTIENFGYMAGATKDFFDRCYNDLLEKSQGLPVFYYVRAGLDGEGTEKALNRIIIGLKWKQVLKPLILKGQWNDNFITLVSEASLNFAIGIEEGIY